MKRTAEQILADRREADKRRFKRYKERQEAMGKRHVSGMISAEAYDLLSRERDRTGDSVAAILDRALIGFFGKSVSKVIPEPETAQCANLKSTESVPLEPQADQEPEPVAYEDVQKTLTLPIVEAEEKAVPDLKTEPEKKVEGKKPVSFDRESMKERIYKMKTEQVMGWKPIARLLNDEGIPSPSGEPGKWSDTAVKRLFKEKEKELTS